MKTMISIALTMLLLTTHTASAASPKPNVLFIAIDDLNDWVGCLGGHPQAKTPNMDALAKRGTLFTNAHIQSPLCNPSRSSLLTGLRPSTTGIYGLAPGIRDVESLKDHVTLPQTFTQAGYHTFTCGKIYHDGSVKPKDQPREFEKWGERGPPPYPPKKFVDTPSPMKAVDWGIFPEHDEDQGDWKIATATIEAIRAAPADKPFFIGAGFRYPHVPCFASQKWFDLYPEESLQLPPVKDDDREDTPMFSWFLHWTLPEPRLSWLRANNQWKPLVRSYLACTSFMDSQIGRVLEALKDSGHEKDTLVVLWSDHGWHIGEKLISGKNSLWDRSTHVPLIFAGPGISSGQRCARPAELLDIFPTLLEMCSFPPRQDIEGHSLVPQLKDAQAPREWPAITTHNHDNHGIRTEKWRFIRYADGSQELYDMEKDPNEWTNLAGDSKYAAVIADLARWIPKTNMKPVSGSASRILTYDPATKQAVWEGKPIDPAMLED